MNHFFPEVNTNRDEWIVMMEDLFKSFHSIHSILSIIVDVDQKNAPLPNVMDCRFGRSNHSVIQYQFNTSNHKGTIMKIV